MLDDFLDWCFNRSTPNFFVPIIVFLLLFFSILGFITSSTTHYEYKPTGTRIILTSTESEIRSLRLRKVKWYDEKKGVVNEFYAKESDIVLVPDTNEGDERKYEELKRKLGK